MEAEIWFVIFTKLMWGVWYQSGWRVKLTIYIRLLLFYNAHIQGFPGAILVSEVSYPYLGAL